jgi:hypothetical protein
MTEAAQCHSFGTLKIAIQRQKDSVLFPFRSKRLRTRITFEKSHENYWRIRLQIEFLGRNDDQRAKRANRSCVRNANGLQKVKAMIFTVIPERPTFQELNAFQQTPKAITATVILDRSNCLTLVFPVPARSE